MDKEKEYKLTLVHVIKWLEGEGGLDMWKPVNLENDNVLTLPRRLSDPLFGSDVLDVWIRNKSDNAPSIGRVREITAKLPSLTKLLLDERNNE